MNELLCEVILLTLDDHFEGLELFRDVTIPVAAVIPTRTFTHAFYGQRAFRSACGCVRGHNVGRSTAKGLG